MMRNLFFFFLSACLSAVTITLNLPAVDAVTGVVVSCPAWTLNKHDELRLFLKGDPRHGLDGEILSYHGIDIEWKRGKKAILSIFDDEKKLIEDVKLYELETRDEMHKLLADKGFLKKTRDQRTAEIYEARTENQLRALGEPSGVYGVMTGLYFVVFGVIVFFGFFLHRKRRTQRSFTGSSLTRV